MAEVNHRFSVVLAVYKGDDHFLFEKSLRSVYENSTKPEEVVLVVDGPVSEEIKNVIDQYKKYSGFKPIFLNENVGLAKALNIGIEYASCDLIARTDSDDFCEPDRFQSQLSLIDEGFDVVGGAIREIDRRGNHIAIRKTPVDHFSILQYCKRRNPMNHVTVMFRKSLFERCGGYPDIYLKEDYGLWASMLSIGGKFANSPDVLVNVTAGIDMYRRRGGWRYVFAELSLQRHLVATGIKSTLDASLDGILRSSVFIAPAFVRKFIYMRYLRN